jgi:thiamine biosynthesis lipoprotein
MGAGFSIKVVTTQDDFETTSFDDVDRQIRAVLDRITRLMSTWDPESELSRFNRSTSLEPFPVAFDTFEVLRWSLDLSALSGGALDVTVGPLVEAWGFGPGGSRDTVPSDEEIGRLRAATGPGRLDLDASRRTVRKTRPDVRCDVSAIAPGYATDLLWTLLAERGFADFLVDVGGELRARGRNERGMPWQITLERATPGTGRGERVVSLANRALTTSGDYRRYREVNGRRLAHILDPRTGRPLAHRLASVTVIDDLAVRADGLATALMVLGGDEGIALATKLNVAALFVERAGGGFSERTTPRFDALAEDRRR